ncbi:MAG: F0F1 ATP synthase subunit epsilon [Bacteroidales bacterium]|nr:F0F1 ATP synthase subunit epsilon [Bacteroidales bacterium]
MKVEIITPEQSLYKGEATSVTVPSMQGPFTMLEHHAAIVAILEAGQVVITDLNQEQHEFAIKGGFCEQHDNQIIICAEVENGK